MTDTTTKEQVIEGTLKAMDEIGEYNREMKEYVRRRLERAYNLGYHHGWTNERNMKTEESEHFKIAYRVNPPSKCDGDCEQCPEDGGKAQCEMWR